MATISPYETKAGRRYRVRYRKPDKTQTDKRGFKTKKEAELFLASVTVSKATGSYIDPQLGRINVASLADQWLVGKEATLKPSTYHSVQSAWKVHVRDQWGAREVATIVPSEVQLWVAKLATNKSATTVSRALGVLSGVLDLAVGDRKLAVNPARNIRVPRKRARRRVYLTHDEVQRLAAASKHPNLVLTLAYTGLRWGEATALRVRDLDEVRRRLNVVENAVLVGTLVHVGTPKTHETRSVPYPKFLGNAFDQMKKGKGPDDLLFGDGKAHMRIPYTKDGWFSGAVKRMQELQATEIKKAEKGTEDHGLRPFPRVTPHDLRHTAVSLAISSGANVKAVQQMLGHASAAMTLDTYAELFDDDLESVAVALDRAAREASKGKSWSGVVGE